MENTKHILTIGLNDQHTKTQNNITRLKTTLKEELTRQAKMTPLVEKLETFYKEL